MDHQWLRVCAAPCGRQAVSDEIESVETGKLLARVLLCRSRQVKNGPNESFFPVVEVGMIPVTRFYRGVLALVLSAIVLVIVLSPLPRKSVAVSSEGMKDKPATSIANAKLQGLVGTSSCSSRGCHGALDSTGAQDKCGQNEYLQWTRDPHADAYRVLFDARSVKIAEHLNGPKGPKAHEDARCLACHATPQAAELPKENPLHHEEKQFGVGCESCHGSAEKWIVSHTSLTWHKVDPEEKWKTYGMVDVTNLSKRAEQCAGCHVGAPRRDGMPLRNMNHDMIAAGHPRLLFEFGTFQANMPPHWRDNKVNQEAYLWTVGQFATAEASLKLLEARVDSGPWPEFAEYDCFACHHGLTASSWRQSEIPRGRKPGALPWGSWSFALMRQLEKQMQVPSSLKQELDSLESSMQKPIPDRKVVAKGVQKTLEQLRRVTGQLDRKRWDEAKSRKLIQAVTGKGSPVHHPSWDSAEQLYLALYALNESEYDKRVRDLLDELTPLRAFRPGFDSPLSIALPNGKEKAFHPAQFLEKLKANRN